MLKIIRKQSQQQKTSLSKLIKLTLSHVIACILVAAFISCTHTYPVSAATPSTIDLENIDLENLDDPTRRALEQKLEEAGVDINALTSTTETEAEIATEPTEMATAPTPEYENPLDIFGYFSTGAYNTFLIILMLTVIATILTIRANHYFKKSISPFITWIPVSLGIAIIKFMQFMNTFHKLGDIETKTIFKSLGGFIAALIIIGIQILIIAIKNLYQSAKILNKAYELDDTNNANIIQPARLGLRYTLIGSMIALLFSIFLIPIWILFLVLGHTFTKQARNMLDANEQPVNDKTYDQADALERLRMRQRQS